MSGHDDNEFVRSFLQARGCSDAVVRGGVPYLIGRWQEIADAIERGYSGDLDEYLNDMDVRQILFDVRAHQLTFTPKPDEFDIDLRLGPLLIRTKKCLWGQANAERNNWTPEKNWWYFSYPNKAGLALQRDLLFRHLIPAAHTR